MDIRVDDALRVGADGQSDALAEAGEWLAEADKKGRFPALEYARTSLARDIIRDRKTARLTQTKLAELAGIRQETLSRIESSKHKASVNTIEKIEKIEKIDRALK